MTKSDDLDIKPTGAKEFTCNQSKHSDVVPHVYCLVRRGVVKVLYQLVLF